MRRYAVVYAVLLGGMLAVFALAQAMDAPVLTDPDPLAGTRGAGAALVGVALLVADVVLPVPSSLVMVGHGALFGIAAGTALSTAGSLGAFSLAFALGRRGGAAVANVVGECEWRRADHLLRRWGVVAIIASRPVPLLAETVAFAAGGSSLPWRSAATAAVLGVLPVAVVYAVVGAAVGSFADGSLAFVAVVVIAVAAAVLSRSRRGVVVGRQ